MEELEKRVKELEATVAKMQKQLDALGAVDPQDSEEEDTVA